MDARLLAQSSCFRRHQRGEDGFGHVHAAQVASSGQWKSAAFRLNGATATPEQPDPPLLEFVITDVGKWDKPIDGASQSALHVVYAHACSTNFKDPHSG